MKTFSTIILSVMMVWCAPLYAEYCKTNDAGRVSSCTFRVTGLARNSQIIISYTQQGWSLMAAIFVTEFVMLEGDASVKLGRTELQGLEYVRTRRDMLTSGMYMEAGVYKVSEEFLHALANSKGTVRLYLPASESEDQKIKATAGKFSKLEDYIAETKAALGL